MSHDRGCSCGREKFEYDECTEADCLKRKHPRIAEAVDHPAHYGGAGDPYEAIKVIEAWKLGFNLGSVLKYICRRDRKGVPLEDLRKARWYLDREIQNQEKVNANPRLKDE